MKLTALVGSAVTLGVLLSPASVSGATARADGARGVTIRVVASSGGDSGEVWVDASAGRRALKGPARLLGQPLRIVSAGRHLGTVESLELLPGVDPSVTLNFSVTAGASATTFTITAGTTAVGATNPWAQASVTLGVTDNNGDGATLTGLQAGGNAYDARYNSGATVWAGLLGTHTAGVNATTNASDQRPASGWEQVLDTVSDIDAQWKFQLTALDHAQGTSTFSVALAGPAAGIAATAGTPQQALVGTPFAQALEATVTDALGIPVAGATVTFTAPASGASGTFPAGNTAVTDGAGKASVPFNANSIVGAYTVTANIAPPLATAAGFDLDNMSPIPALGGAAMAALVLVLLLVGVLALRRVA